MTRRSNHDDPWADDLAKLRGLRWGQPEEIADSLDHLLTDESIVAAARFPKDRVKRVEALAKFLDKMLIEVRRREDSEPRPFGRSIWYAGSLLLRRSKGNYEGKDLRYADVATLYEAIENHWRLTRDSVRGKAGEPLGPGTFKEHHQADVYKKLANELRNLANNRAPGSTEAATNLSPLVAQGVGSASDDSPTPGVAHNIPPGTYLRFLPRDQEAQVELDLASSLPVISIVGVGGVGKSSLARHIASRVADGELDLPFTAVVWVSDKASPGSTTLSLVLDQLADVLDLPGLKKAPTIARSDLATQYCRSRAVLFIVDNANTITDQTLLSWLQVVPDPSRVLLTSREELSAFAESSAVVRLGGFDEEAARKFTELVLAKLGSSDSRIADDVLQPLVQATAGNAKAIEVALGATVNGGIPFARVLETFALAHDDLFTDLFRECWRTLDQPAKDTLFALSVLPFGAPTELVASLLEMEVTGVGQALGILKGLALVDPDWNDRPSPIFTLNALVAAFVEGQKSDHRPRVTEIEDQSVVVLREVAASVGFCPHDIQRLLTLDDVELRRNIEFTVRWCVERERSHDVIALTRDIRYWYYVRGVWSPDPDPNLTRAVAARALGDASEECDALLYYCNIAAKAENAAALQRHLPRVEKILGELPSGDPRQASSRHVHALAALAKGDNARAVELWEENLAQTELDDADLSANRRWLGIALYRRGSHGEARQVLNEAVAHDTQINFRRAIVSSKLQLVRIDLSLHLSHRSDEAAHDIPTLSGQLQDLEPEVAKLSDPLYSGEWSELYGKAALLQHLNADAERFLQQAEATFQRLGLLSRANAIKHDLMSLREQHT